MELTTKARTLAALAGSLELAEVPPSVWFTVGQWRAGADAVGATVRRALGPGPWMVRSSAAREDQRAASHAGEFLSVPEVRPSELGDAVEQVVRSYGQARDDDEVLVQPMLREVVRSGVAYSHDPHSGAPYRVVTTARGPDTAAVTSGRGGTTFVRLGGAHGPVTPEEALLEELLRRFGGTPLGCEFAVQRDGRLWLLQVRPMVCGAPAVPGDRIGRLVHAAQEQAREALAPTPDALGGHGMLGVMPDWNPAELLGLHPRPLALSLFGALISDRVWAEPRWRYGYRDMRGVPLVVDLCGHAYVDVRASFTSLVPADLDRDLADRLVRHYLRGLHARPEVHDRVELDLVLSCATLDLPDRLAALAAEGFSAGDRDALGSGLRRLTRRLLRGDGPLAADMVRLERQRDEAPRPALPAGAGPLRLLRRALDLVRQCGAVGTPLFAGLARGAFVAVRMLRSAVTAGVVSARQRDAVLGSVRTVTTRLLEDRDRLPRDEFLRNYGHLRPGTFDVTVPRYDEAPDLYFGLGAGAPLPAQAPVPRLDEPTRRALDRSLAAQGLPLDGEGLAALVRQTLAARELAKFRFSRRLSDALQALGRAAASLGLTREDLAFCSLPAVRRAAAASTPAGARDLLAGAAARGRVAYQEAGALRLPPLVGAPEQVWAFFEVQSVPTYVTRQRVCGPVLALTEDGAAPASGAAQGPPVSGRVLCIPRADPGFDWIFARPVAGLVTAWGGPNSHMAVRAGELGLPAAIGVGERQYAVVSGARHVCLDCEQGSVVIIA